jgi:hypothetical protein
MEDTTIEDVLKTVESLYSKKAYREALDYLANNKGHVSKGLWHYNMGTIFASLEDWPMARYHLSMADLHGYTSRELLSNQSLVEDKLLSQKWEKPITPMDYVIRGALLGSDGILTFFGLVIMIIGIFLLKNQLKKRAFMLLSVSLLLFGMTLWIKTWNWGIVLKPQVLREGPSAIFNSKDEIPAGVKVLTLKEGEWVKVIFPERFEGWIRNAEIKELR